MVRRRSLFSRRMRSCSKLLISSTCFCSSSTWFCSPSIVSVKLWREEGAQMRSQVLERCFFLLENASLWKVLPVSSTCPRSVTTLAFHGSGWFFSVWSLLNGGVCVKGWGTEVMARDCTNLRPSVLNHLAKTVTSGTQVLSWNISALKGSSKQESN